MVYCIADIHGEYDRYLAMLEKIRFSDTDTLYILGDCIDRGPCGVDVLLDVMARPNCVLLLGNHEQMCLDDLYWHEWDAKRRWHNNGGSATRRDLLYRRPEVKGKILQFLRKAPSFVELEVGDKAFHLVHGYPAEESYERIWNRPAPGMPAPIPGVTVIVGHTPTVFLNGDDGRPFRIWHGEGVLCIDCGCGNKTELRRLACLRLDDMQEFYV